jgi:hypothetical protein
MIPSGPRRMPPKLERRDHGAAMKVKLQIAHQVPGRIRMKVPSAKGNPAMLQEIQDAFSAIPGIEQVVVNPETGSVVLKYGADRHDDFHAGFTHRCNEYQGHVPGHGLPPSNEIDDLVTKIQEEADFLAEHSEAAKAVVDFCKHWDREIKVASGNLVDLKIVLCVGLVGCTIFEIGAAAATPVWVTLTLFGSTHFIEMQASWLKPRASPRAIPSRPDGSTGDAKGNRKRSGALRGGAFLMTNDMKRLPSLMRTPTLDGS